MGPLAGRIRLVMGVAVAVRVALLPLAPSLSDDVYRYAWDGKVARAGLDPYGHPPNAEALTELRDERVWPSINHPYLRTIYPPVAQMAFAAFGLLGDGVLPMKLLSVTFDLGTALLLAWLLRRRGRDPAWVALYAWHPGVIAETAWSGHMDPLAWFFLVAAIALLEARPRWAGVALALSAGAKLLAGAVWPFWVRRSRVAAVMFPLTLAAVTAPYLVRSGPHMFASLDTYGRKWAGNAGAFALIEQGAELALRPVEPVEWRRKDAAGDAARGIVVLLFLAVLARQWLRRATPEDAAFAAVAAFVVLSPTVHPWYVMWLAPFIALGRPRAWLLLTLLAPLSYVELGVVAWIGFAGLWLFDATRTRGAAEG